MRGGGSSPTSPYKDFRYSTRQFLCPLVQSELKDVVVVLHHVAQGRESTVVGKAALVDLSGAPQRP